MQFYRRNWYYIGAILFVVLAFIIGFFGKDIEPVRLILILSFMALLVHQFEEYGLPGGFPAIFNIAMSGEKDVPNRYPINAQGSFVVNVVCAYTFYILPIIFIDWYWLGILSMVFGFSQLLAHGIVMNLKIKSFYNPGLAAVVFLHVPIGIYYMWYIHTYFVVEAWHWWVGIFALPVAMFVLVLLPIQIFKSKKSPYPFTQDEMDRFNVKEKVSRINKR